MRHPANRTFPMDSIPVDSVGRIKLDDLQYIFKEHDEVALVSVQYGNNEVGTIQPVQEIAELCRENGTLFHTDACQAFGKVPFDVEEMGIDMASVSAHKIHGPMGIGALYVKEGTNLKPLLHGGGQENGMRSGTLAVPLIVGFGKAVEMAQTHLKGMKRIYRMVSTMATKLEHIGATRNGDPENRLPHILSVSFPDLPGASLVGALNKMGICVAMGSACRTRKNQSHVLEALGIDYLTNNHTIRISPSRYTEDIDAHGLVRAIQQIRRNPGELEYL
jgi:cysteine desulfurase